MKIGIDFGTTNSAVAVLRGDGVPQILELAPGERTQRTVIHCSTDGTLRFGNAAFRAYVDADLSGRFLRSIKAFLAQDVPRTRLGSRTYAFPELVTAYLRFLVDAAERVSGERVTDVVVGRPVHFHADPARDAAATERLRSAVSDAGLPHCTMQLEPVAAAHRFERDLTEPRTVLVGDFGGGTADFAILRAGPRRAAAPDRRGDILATSGVAQAGDALDGRFMDVFLLDDFGRGTTVHKRYSTVERPWTHPIMKEIQQLYYLHMLRSPDLQRRLQDVAPRISDPRVIERLLRLIFDDLGYPMAWAIEQSKRALSHAPETRFRFEEFYSEALNIDRTVDHATFAASAASLVSAYSDAIDEALATAALGPDDIDDVFLTGGTSQLPFLKALFAQRLGATKLRSSDAFTTVCEGLALS